MKTPKTSNASKHTRTTSQECRLQQRMVVRTCGTKDMEETRWWVVEGRVNGRWTPTIDEWLTERQAVEHLVRTIKEMPQHQWRLVEVVERRTAWKLRKTSSHNDPAVRPASEDVR